MVSRNSSGALQRQEPAVAVTVDPVVSTIRDKPKSASCAWCPESMRILFCHKLVIMVDFVNTTRSEFTYCMQITMHHIGFMCVVQPRSNLPELV